MDASFDEKRNSLDLIGGGFLEYCLHGLRVRRRRAVDGNQNVSKGNVRKSSPASIFDPLDKKGAIFASMLTEAAYRASRSENAGRSCKLLAAAFRSLANQSVSVKSRMIDFLAIIVPMLPVEHVEPILALHRDLMCED